jgi:hypothetical protein
MRRWYRQLRLETCLFNLVIVYNPSTSDEMTPSWVYGLIDPRDQEIRYVGATRVGLEERLHAHVGHMKKAAARSRNDYDRWLAELFTLGLQPRVTALEFAIMLLDELAERESHWISRYLPSGNLVNGTSTGYAVTAGRGVTTRIYFSERQDARHLVKSAKMTWTLWSPRVRSNALDRTVSTVIFALRYCGLYSNSICCTFRLKPNILVRSYAGKPMNRKGGGGW